MSQNWFFFFYNIDILNFLLSNICIKPDIVRNKNNNEMSLNTKRNTIIKQASKAMLLDFDFDVWCFNKNARLCTPFTEDLLTVMESKNKQKCNCWPSFWTECFARHGVEEAPARTSSEHSQRSTEAENEWGGQKDPQGQRWGVKAKGQIRDMEPYYIKTNWTLVRLCLI